MALPSRYVSYKRTPDVTPSLQIRRAPRGDFDDAAGQENLAADACREGHSPAHHAVVAPECAFDMPLCERGGGIGALQRTQLWSDGHMVCTWDRRSDTDDGRVVVE